MEKISIVRRRLEMPPTQAEIRARQRMESADDPGGTTLAVMSDASNRIASVLGGEPEMKVDLSDEARQELWSGGHLEESGKDRRNFIVEAEKTNEDGRVVLKLQFMKPDYFLRLLTTEEVCEMLHVSRSSLYQYAHNGELRTYRMGRGLRYRFQDVLDFLTRCQTRDIQEG